MKQKIKSLTNRTVRLFWEKNGWHHNAVGIIKKPWKVQFDFNMNGEMLIRIRYDNVKDVELIK